MCKMSLTFVRLDSLNSSYNIISFTVNKYGSIEMVDPGHEQCV